MSFVVCHAQQVQIVEDPAITEMMSVWVNSNRINPRISGWRVQLLSSTDRRQIEEGKAKFKSQFPGIRVDWFQEKPYYKLRAGAFLSKSEAMGLIFELKAAYPSAYAAQDFNIHPRDFLE